MVAGVLCPRGGGGAGWQGQGGGQARGAGRRGYGGAVVQLRQGSGGRRYRAQHCGGRPSIAHQKPRRLRRPAGHQAWRGDGPSLTAPGTCVGVYPLRANRRGYRKSLRWRRGVRAAGIAFAWGSSGYPPRCKSPTPPHPNMDQGTQASETKTVLQQPTKLRTAPRLASPRRAVLLRQEHFATVMGCA
ncbi:hypothetical protein E2C01_061823 [Portunus trituberculatus]|uniref:Uncharacterized protein n=1 Tax=Portunus trituberculatus TaxID=210409 RepID=A0A5B7HCA3_PORTR|nr:hypothetical protein [Portunus trituberculatus]